MFNIGDKVMVKETGAIGIILKYYSKLNVYWLEYIYKTNADKTTLVPKDKLAFDHRISELLYVKKRRKRR